MTTIQQPGVLNAIAAPTSVRPIKAHVSFITPAVAKEMLSKNTHNRPVSKSHVTRLAKELVTGRWKMNGDTIRFANGVLVDGQHRLAACVESNVGFKTLIVNGLDANVFDTIDAGRQRSVGDTLAVRGEKNSAKLAATLRFVDMCLTERTGSKEKFSNVEIEEVLDRHPGVRESVEYCSRDKKGVVPVTILAACHYLFHQKDPVLADRVADQLNSGEGLVKGDPIYQVRERLVSASLHHRKMTGQTIAALLVKGWNQLRTGTRTNVLSWRAGGASPEAFPVAA